MTQEKSPLIAANDQEATHNQQAAGQVRSDHYTTENNEETLDQPLNWNSSWKHIPLHPTKGNLNKRPTIKMSKYMDDPPDEYRRLSEAYWDGLIEATWDDLNRAIKIGRWVGLIPELSNLVILDCDVKTYRDGDGYVYLNDGTVQLADTVEKHGIDDLRREVEKLGHSLSELKTYTVGTKSGGYHLYFKQNPRYPIKNKMQHRHEWRVDVITGLRNWVVAPPTPRYTVVTDVEVIEMPDWLAIFLTDLTKNIPLPSGGVKRQRADDAVKKLKQDYDQAIIPGSDVVDDPDDLWNMYVESLLRRIVLGNKYGGWNDAIYGASLALFRAGYDYASVCEAVIGVAEAVDKREEMKALDTIASAHRYYRRHDYTGA